MTAGEWLTLIGIVVGVLVPSVGGIVASLWYLNSRMSRIEARQESMEQLRQLMTEFVLKMRDND